MINIQEKGHIQNQVQEYERKAEMSMRVIDETTLRILLPRVADTAATLPLFSALSSGHSTATTLLLKKRLLIYKVHLCY